MADDAPGPRMSLTVAGGCPSSSKDPVTGDPFVGVTNPPPTWSGTFLPPQDPTGGLICRYYGLNGQPFQLKSQSVLDATDALAQAGAMRQVPLTCAFCDGTYSCPMDDGSIDVVVFNYTDRPDVAVWVKANGCRTMSNGSIIIDAVDTLPT